MSVRIISAFTASVLLLGLSPSTAHAKALDKCGGIYLTSASHCEFKPVQQCETTCSTTSVDQVCAQSTYNMCSASCTTTDTTSCTQSRSEACSMECDTIVNKSSREVCVEECSDDCTSEAISKHHFGGDANRCSQSCKHDCNVQCERCSETDQTTDCMTKCTSVVENECLEQVNRDCVLSCQTDNYTTCETDTVNTCNTTCKDKGGAIFCDGQYINASNLQDCADQLAEEFSFNIDIDVDATVTTTVNGTKKTAKANCSFGPASPGSEGMLVGALAVLGLAIARRRKA